MGCSLSAVGCVGEKGMISATAEQLCVRLLIQCRAPEATPGEAKWPAMHNSAARTAAAGFMDMPNSSTDAYVVAVDRRRIGVAVAAGGRLHFIAADPDFRPLDGSSFLHLAQLKQAAERLARTVRGPRVLPGG